MRVHILQMHTMGLCLHAQVCGRKCVHACMFTRVLHVCGRAFMEYKQFGCCNCDGPPYLWNGRQRERTLPFYAYTVYIYTDGLWGKNKKQVLFTRWTMVALPTLDENRVWLHLITAKSFHMAAVCSESVMFLNINTWFFRSALFFSPPRICTATAPLVHWFVKTHRISSLIG